MDQTTTLQIRRYHHLLGLFVSRATVVFVAEIHRASLQEERRQFLDRFALGQRHPGRGFRSHPQRSPMRIDRPRPAVCRDIPTEDEACQEDILPTLR
jgi:hypothetical protein